MASTTPTSTPIGEAKLDLSAYESIRNHIIMRMIMHPKMKCVTCTKHCLKYNVPFLFEFRRLLEPNVIKYVCAKCTRGGLEHDGGSVAWADQSYQSIVRISIDKESKIDSEQLSPSTYIQKVCEWRNAAKRITTEWNDMRLRHDSDYVNMLESHEVLGKLQTDLWHYRLSQTKVGATPEYKESEFQNEVTRHEKLINKASSEATACRLKYIAAIKELRHSLRHSSIQSMGGRHVIK